MITIPQHEIDQAAADNAGLSITEISAFKKGAQWMQDRLTPKKHTNKANFVIVYEMGGRNPQRLEDGEFSLWLSAEKAQPMDIIAMRAKVPVGTAVKKFLEKRSGDFFNDHQHLFNSFRKFWENYVPEEKSSKNISQAHDEYFS
jgi:hypothetical protein